MSSFQRFWEIYPRREAKLAAMKAWDKALKLDTAENIIAGVERYRLRMPEERQYRPLPATFLNQGRWMDEEDAPITLPARTYWADECAEMHGGACLKQWDHEVRKRATA